MQGWLVTLPGTVWVGISQGVNTRRAESLRVILEAHSHTQSLIAAKCSFKNQFQIMFQIDSHSSPMRVQDLDYLKEWKEQWILIT